MNCKKLNCKAIALKTDSYCYMHSKKISEAEKKTARSKGGKHKTIKIDATDPNEFQTYDLNTFADVMRVNAELINRILNGSYNIKAGTGIAYLLSIQLKAIELNKSVRNIYSDILVTLPPEFEELSRRAGIEMERAL